MPSVIQQNHVGNGCGHDFGEEARQLERPLVLGEVERAPR